MSDGVSQVEEKQNPILRMNVLEEENSVLKKQVRLLEAEARKNQAILEQKIELLESSISDTKKREQNLNKMNETIMSALNDMNNDSKDPRMIKTIRELELATEQHQKEMQEYKSRTNEHIKFLEKENKELRERLSETELLYKEFQIKFEKGNVDVIQNLKELQSEKCSLESIIKKFEEEKKQSKELYDYEMNLKMNELKISNEKLKEDHRKELEHLNAEYDKSLKDLKAIYGSERHLLESRLDRTSNLLKKTQEESENKAILVEMQNLHQAELEQIHKSVEEMRNQHVEEVEYLTRQRDEAIDRSEKLDANLKKLKVQLKCNQGLQEQNSKILKEKLDKAKNIMEQGEILVEENKKQKQKIQELKAQIKKLEGSEKRLKDLMLDKDIKIDEERIEFKKLLNADQRLITRDPNVISSKPPNLLSRSLVQGNSPFRQEDNNIGNRSIMARTDLNREENEFKNIRESPNKFPSDILDLSNIVHVDDGLRHSTTYLSAHNELQSETRNHTPVKLLQSRFDVSKSDQSIPPENGNQQRIDKLSVGARLPRSTSNRGDHSFNERYGRIVENLSSGNFDSSSIIIRRIEKTNPLASEQFNTLFPKASEMNNKSDLAQENQYEVINDFIEGHYTNEVDGYSNSTTTLTQKETATLRNTNDKERFLDAKYSLSTVENLGITPKGFKNNKQSDEDYDKKSFGDDDEDYLDSLLTQSPFNGRPQLSYNTQSSSIDLFMQANKSIGSSIPFLSHHTSTDSRAKIEERLKLLEQKLREMELRNQGLKVEKDKVQVEFEKLLFELKQAKLDTSTLTGDKKDDKEMALKNEIKFLISKLLKVKNKLEKQSEKVTSNQDIKRRPSLESTTTLNNINNLNMRTMPSAALGNVMKDNTQMISTQLPSYLMHKENLQGLHQRTAEDHNLKINKGSLGEAIENFSKNIRSKSNIRSEAPKPNPINNYNNVLKTSNRAKTPLFVRAEEQLSVSSQNNVNNSMINIGSSWNRKNL